MTEMTYDQGMEETLEAPQPATITLTAQDRCDRCGAQAYHRATLPSELELLFCNHDLEKNMVKLVEIEARVESDPSGAQL
jgi:hypothetical protein